MPEVDARDLLRLVSSGVTCSPNDQVMGIEVPAGGCIAEHVRATRGGYLTADCVDNLRAPAVPGGWPRYEKDECKGNGKLFQAEGVAQARMVAKGGGSVSADQQWELVALRTPTTTGRIDYLHYTASDLSSDIDLVELKKGRLGSTAQDRARDQVNDYADNFPDSGAHLVQPKEWTTTYKDQFSIAEKCEPGRATRLVRDWKVESAATDGVVMFWEASRRTERCDEDPKNPPIAEEDEEEPRDPPIRVSKSQWDEIERQIRKWMDEHPEEVETVKEAATAAALIAVVPVVIAAVPVLGPYGAAAAAIALVVLLLILGDLPDPIASGDPHMYTLDQLSYDLQAVGEFHLLEIPQRGIDVQLRTRPVASSVSVTDRVATEVNGHLVELTDAGVLIDGAPFALEDGEAALIGRDGILRRKGNERFVHWTFAGEMITLSFGSGQVGLSVPPGLPTWGLAGNNDGDPANDLRLADGTPLPASTSAAQLHGPFADSWRINDEESLFTYAAGESTVTFTDRTFPQTLVTIADFPAAAIETATDRCADAGVVSGPQFNDCVYDILVTGDDAWAQLAAAVTDDLVDPHAKGFVDGVLSEDFTAPVAENFAAARYLNDPATSRVAGPFFDDTPYSFFVTEVGRHDELVMTARLVAYGDVDGDASTQQVSVTVDGETLAPLALEGPGSTAAGGSTASVRTGVTAQGEPFRVYDLVVPLQHFGDALKVKLTPVNFRGVIDTGMGVNNLTLELGTTPADDFAVTLPASVAVDEPGAGAGRIETPGAEDGYTFALGESADLGVFRISGDAVRVNLIGPDGTRVQPSESSGQFWRFNDLVAGDYAVRVHGPQGSGSPATYGLTINTIPADPRVDYQVGDPAVTVTTVAAGQNAHVTFSGQRGQRVQMRTTGASYTGGTMRWHVTAPDGSSSLPWPQSLIGSAANELQDTWRLPADGTYTATFDPEGIATGSVTFRAWAVAEDVVESYTLDAPTRRVTTTPGQNATLTFQGMAGQRIFMQTTDASYEGGGMRWQVTAPDGSNSLPWPQSVIGSPANALHEVWTLPADGTYTVRIDPESEAAGSVRFRAWTVPTGDVLVPYTLDDQAVTVATASGQNAVVTFQGRAGQCIQLRTTDAAYVDGGMRWQVIAPDGTNSLPWPQSVIGSGANELQDTWRLPVDGTYTVTIDPDGTAHGSVKFRAWTVPDDVELEYALDDPATTVTTTGAGQNAKLTFQGQGGQRIQMRTTDAAYTEGGMRWHVIAPDGSNSLPWPQSLNGHGANDFQDTWVLPATGTYTVTFDPAAMATGSVKFRAWTVPNDVELEYALDDPAITVTTTVAGQNAKMTFQGQAGQRIQMRTTDAAYTEGGMRWHVIAPDGSNSLPWPQSLNGHGANDFQDTWVLPATGTYTVTIDPETMATGSVKFRAWTVPDDRVLSFALGDPDLAIATVSGQNATAAFAGVQGQRIRLQTRGAAYTDAGMRWNLQRPDGSYVWSGLGVQWRYANDTTEPVTLDQSGDWKVVIDPESTATGTVNLRAWIDPA